MKTFTIIIKCLFSIQDVCPDTENLLDMPTKMSSKPLNFMFYLFQEMVPIHHPYTLESSDILGSSFTIYIPSHTTYLTTIPYTSRPLQMPCLCLLSINLPQFTSPTLVLYLSLLKLSQCSWLLLFF